MRFSLVMPIRTLAAVMLWLAAMPHTALAAPVEPTGEQIDSAPCMAALSANDDDRIIASCAALIGNDKAPKADRVKAAIARASAYDRKGDIDRRIGDRVHALADFGAAVRLVPNHAAAKANYKSLSLEIERIGAMMAVNNRPSFNCATARRPVEKAICANPELANLDREINAVNTRVVRETAQRDPRAGRAMQREQDDFIARRNADFGKGDFDLQKMMRDRLDHLMGLVNR